MNAGSCKGYDLARSVAAEHHVVSDVTLDLSSDWNRSGKGPLYLRRSKGTRVFLDELVQKHFRPSAFYADADICLTLALWKHPDVPSRRFFMPNVDFELRLVFHHAISHRILQSCNRLVILAGEKSSCQDRPSAVASDDNPRPKRDGLPALLRLN